jgi:protein-serine/threonine kinase
MEGPEPSRRNPASQEARGAADSSQRTQMDPADTSSARGNSSYHIHIRAPSSQGLTVQTDFAARSTPRSSSLLEESADALRQSATATAPITINEQSYLRNAWSANSMGSLSPASASLLSSPALNALGDITPLPSPLMGDSPGPWHSAARRPSRDALLGDSLLSQRKASLSSSPSLKKKAYQKLKEAAIEAAVASHSQHKSDAARERTRSISDYTPDSLHNARPRHVTIGNAAIEADANVQQHLHREQYLAMQRGLVPPKLPAALPTPPASNASNRSVTDTEEDDVAEDDENKYIVVRQGPERTKTRWRQVRQLGQGTFSTVYLATCEKIKTKDPLDETVLDPRKLVAIKVVHHGPAGGADEERVELGLKREVEMLRSVSHPSLVHLQAFDHDDAQAHIVLTYCPGGDLFDVASDHREVLTVGVVQRIFAEMVSAVRYLHGQLIVHRDIKLESTAHYFFSSR